MVENGKYYWVYAVPNKLKYLLADIQAEAATKHAVE